MSNHTSPQKHISFDRHGDTIEVVIRDSSFKKTYQNEVNITNRKGLEDLLIDLKNKGVDFIGIIRRKMIEDSEWFD